MKRLFKPVSNRYTAPFPVSALTVLLLVSPSSWGQFVDTRFTGTIDNDWSVGGNWLNGAPSSGSRAIIDAGNSVQLAGAANTGQLFIGAGSDGRLTVSGGALHVASALVLANAGSVNGSLEVNGGGLLDVNTLYLGIYGTATLNVSASHFVLASQSWIGGGDTSGANGSLALTAGSVMNASGILTVGDNGSTGSITANGTSTLNTSTVVLANGSGSTANVTLSGGSDWVSSGTFTVGSGGAAHLTVSEGSTLTDNVGVIGSGGSTNATVNISGAGSKWVNNSTLYVGATGNGALVIGGGGNVTSAATFIGRQGTSNSTVTVSGGGSQLQAGNLTIGGDAGSGSGGGQGRLSVTGGANATASSVELGVTVGSRGALLIDNGNMTASGRASIGNTGHGNLTITGGGTLTDAGALVGHNSGSTGTANVSGVGSQWTNNGVLYVGNVGNGALNVSAGGKVTSTDGYVATESGSFSNAVIDGAGSAWVNSGDFFVGHNNGANGSVRITNGGSISDVQGILGDLAGASGNMTVTGSGSTWSSTSDVNVGRLGNGKLTVADSGTVTGGRIYIANNAGSFGTVLLTGGGSTLAATNALHVGASGNGTLTVADGAMASASMVSIATSAGATGVVNIGAAAGSTATAAGILNTSNIAFGAGNGTLNLNHNASSAWGRYTLGAALSGNGTINQLAGDTLLTGNSAAFTGVTNISGGSMGVNGTLGGTINVGNGGTLGGSGTVGSVNVNANGFLSPGNSIGTLTVNGDLTFQSGATYRVEADAARNSDQVVVTGTATLNGNVVALADSGGTYQANTRYTILTAQALSGSFNSTVASSLAFLNAALTQDTNNVYLSLSRNDIDYADVAQTRNQRSIATALQSAGTGGVSTGMSDVLTAVNNLSADKARTAFESMGGAGLVGLQRTGTHFTGNFSSQLNGRLQLVGVGRTAQSIYGVQLAANDRLGDLMPALVQNTVSDGPPSGKFSLGGSIPVDDGQRGFWLRGYGFDQDTDGDGNAASTHTKGGGVSGGFDKRIQNNLLVGAAFSHGTSDVRASHAETGKSRGNAVAAYVSYASGPWNFNGNLVLAHNANTMKRNVAVGAWSGTARSNFDSKTAAVYGEASYDLPKATWTLQPLAGLSVTLNRNDGFTETGAGAVNLQTDAQNTTSTKTLFGARALFEFNGIHVQPRAIWAHEFGDVNKGLTAQLQGLPGAGFTTYGVDLPRDSVIVGVTVAGKARNGLSLFSDVQGEFNSKQKGVALLVGVRKSW